MTLGISACERCLSSGVLFVQHLGFLTMRTALLPQKSAAIPTAAADSVTKSLDADMEAERKLAAMVCSIKNKDECLACGA